MKSVIRRLPILVLFLLALPALTQAQSKNGFDLSNAIINVDDILRGGPPKNGIPAIDNPKFVRVNQVDYLQDDDIVLGVVRNGQIRAYPLRILIWHEIVNDVVGGEPLAITYCPLCASAMVFERTINNEVRLFGVSGLLYQSDVLLYDRESESLFSQLAMKAVSGKEVNTALNWVTSEHLTWAAWRQKYPQSMVLSTDTGFNRNYQGEAYGAYFASDRTMFPVKHTRRELANKAMVIGVIVGDEAKAYPIKKLPDKAFSDTVGTQQIMVSYDKVKQFPQITDSNGKAIPSVMVFWFAWQAFYPNTQLWQ